MTHTLTQASQNLESNQKNLRIANLNDREFIFDLANDPIVRQTSFSSEPITWEEHCKWFDSQLKQKNPFYIVEYGNAPQGYVRFQEEIKHSKIWILSVAISSSMRGHGLGLFAVKEACQRVLLMPQVKNIVAMVKRDNKASIKLFKRIFFMQKAYSTNVDKFYYSSYVE